MDTAGNLLFLWDSQLGTEKNCGVPLSGAYKIAYDSGRERLDIRTNPEYVEGFWGRQSWDCFAVVGDNGVGKTMLMDYIMEDIQILKFDLPEKPAGRFILVFGRAEEDGLLIFCSKGLEKLKISAEPEISWKIIPSGNNSGKYLEDMETAYFHNTLSHNDYFHERRCGYDFSLGNMISSYQAYSYEMHYNDISSDPVKDYFDQELLRIVKFLYDCAMKDTLEIEFPVPKGIYISVADGGFYEDYVFQTASKRFGIGDLQAVSEIEQIREAVDCFVTGFGRTWISSSVKYAILNCFRALCLPSAIPAKVNLEMSVFSQACAFMKDKKQVMSEGLYGCAYRVIQTIRTQCEDDRTRMHLEHVYNFIRWLETNEKRIRTYADSGMTELFIRPGKDTEEFMKELLEHYGKINLEFPFLKISFGVSSGEYTLLSVFADLYSMVYDTGTGVAPCVNSDSPYGTGALLLIFDEADISLHPKWQRMYMKWLLDFCLKMFPADLNVKIILTTHSPILLSDFPAHSVCCLSKAENGTIAVRANGRNTFASNIHTLYLDSFFLDDCGTMGAFAEETINGIAEKLLTENGGFNNIREMKTIISYIGEGLLKQKLEEAMEQYTHMEIPRDSVKSDGAPSLRDALQGLKEQRDYLDSLIRKLEGNT